MKRATLEWLKQAEKAIAGLNKNDNTALRAIRKAMAQLTEKVPRGEECPKCQRYVRMPYNTPHPSHDLVEIEGSTIYRDRFATETRCTHTHCGASIYSTVAGTHYDDELLYPCYPILYPDNYPDDEDE